MKRFFPAVLLLLLPILFHLPEIVTSQTRERTVAPTRAESAIKTETIKTNVDLVNVDVLVLEKNTSRVVGDLGQNDFTISEDGVSHEMAQFEN